MNVHCIFSLDFLLLRRVLLCSIKSDRDSSYGHLPLDKNLLRLVRRYFFILRLNINTDVLGNITFGH